MNKKPTILLCWGYNRKNWIEYFEALNDHFNFIYLFYLYPSEEQGVFTQNKRIYYTDFKSPKQLLTLIAPAKVVFMGLDSLLTIALNIQCKKDGIPTYFMSHGAASLSIQDYEDFRFKNRSLLKESLTHKLYSWVFIFKFLIKALGFKHISALPSLMRFQLRKVKIHPLIAMKKNKTSLRIPSKYIVFSNEDVKFYMQLDNSHPNDFIILGNLEISAAIQISKEKGIKDNGYLLYIETPLSKIEGNEFDINKLTIQECNLLISSINRYAMQHHLQLVVKLHPYSYKNAFFIQHPNITYEQGNNKESLILNAHAIIFYNSSLAIPSLFFKPCCMFTVGSADEFQSTIIDLNICTVVDYKNIIDEPASIKFFLPGKKAKDAFIEKYIGAGSDGRGLDRLRDTLLN